MFKKDFLIPQGELVSLALPCDRPDPILIWCEVMTNKEVALFSHSRMQAMGMVDTQGMADEEIIRTKACVAVEQNAIQLKRKVKKLSNIPADETHPEKWETEDTGIIGEFIDHLMPMQSGTLSGALSDYNELGKLKFRVESLPGNKKREGEGGGGEQEDAGPSEGSV